ncbi:MAG: hypothetical protein LEGION0398_MBIBDBAK_00059 [Legionellaceae bacterium]
MSYSVDTSPLEKSKTQKKQDMHALQELGAVLVKLPAKQLSRLPLDSELLEAIELAKIIKSNEAKRRQIQYIGKLMRGYESSFIDDLFKQIEHKDEIEKVRKQQIEHWCIQLMTGGDQAITEFLAIYPQIERQYLRQLIRKAIKDINKENLQAKLYSKELFTFIKSILF